MKGEIVSNKCLEEPGKEFFNVLLVGQAGSGKSSFVNNVYSLFSDHVLLKADTRSTAATKSVTKKVFSLKGENLKWKHGFSFNLTKN